MVTTAPLSLAMMSFGVPFGVQIACQGAMCRPGTPASSTVGTSGAFALDDNGQNFFTLTGVVGSSVTFVTSLTSGGAETDIVDEVRQIRLGGQVTAIPEPETYALMMAGLAAVGFIGRRRKLRK